MERLPFRVNRDADLAKRFATTLSRAPLIPLAITGAAFGVIAEQVISAPIAYAQERCVVNLEVQRPTAEGEYVVSDKTTLPVSCSKRELIELNAAEKGSIKVNEGEWIIHSLLWGLLGATLGISVGVLTALPSRK